MKLEECTRVYLLCSSVKRWTAPVNINNFRYEFYCFTYASLEVVTSLWLTTPFFCVIAPRLLVIGCRPFEGTLPSKRRERITQWRDIMSQKSAARICNSQVRVKDVVTWVQIFCDILYISWQSRMEFGTACGYVR
jgi:hypothetical protein